MNLWAIGGYMSALMTWPIGFISYIPEFLGWLCFKIMLEIDWLGSLFDEMAMFCFEKAGHEVVEDEPPN